MIIVFSTNPSILWRKSRIWHIYQMQAHFPFFLFWFLLFHWHSGPWKSIGPIFGNLLGIFGRVIFVQGICASRVFHFSYLVLSFLLSNFFFSILFQVMENYYLQTVFIGRWLSIINYIWKRNCLLSLRKKFYYTTFQCFLTATSQICLFLPINNFFLYLMVSSKDPCKLFPANICTILFSAKRNEFQIFYDRIIRFL